MQQWQLLHVPLDFLDATSGIAANRFVTLHTSPWSDQQCPTSTSWDPYKVEDVNGLDKVQRRAARCVSNNYTERTQERLLSCPNLTVVKVTFQVLDF